MIYTYKPKNEFYTNEKCFITELLNSDADADCSVARARIEPGITTELHALLGTTERYVILEGEGVVEIDGCPATRVTTYDVVWIPEGACQRITNSGTGDLVFLAICTPRFRPGNYLNMEKE
ncbi:cupin domain-containing protein [Desulfogranum japonicum]|uniref:cupin domain-containing protein n=1 Tax=Desulfogranum japonicum TaxID=231447 RepID=UPI0004292D97|nr:cupin domain-containing protein [Desulfogranum japonicum]